MISKLNFSTDKDSDNMKLETELMTRVKGHPNVVRADDVVVQPHVVVAASHRVTHPRRHRGLCALQVELRETFEDHAYYFLVMEKCAGGELMDRIIANQRFSEKVLR